MDKRLFRIGALLILVVNLIAPAISAGSATTLPSHTEDEVGFIGGGSVSRASFTEAVVNREPRNRITELPNTRQFIFYFTELKGMAGQTIIHRWLRDGRPIYEEKFDVGSSRWRIWSSLPLQREWLGEWVVQVVNEVGQVVHSDSFNYTKAVIK